MFSDIEKNRAKPDSENCNWLIVGLGNPGSEYEKTRHNLGFMVIDLLAREFNVQVKRKECRSLIGQTSLDGQTIELVKPQTFMNLSGEAISCLLAKDERRIEKSIVVLDDLAIPFGTIRLRAKGSDGGHNGLKSIATCLKTRDYIRLRIGIKPEHPISNTRRFVLERFSKRDIETVQDVLKKSVNAIRCLISEDLQKAMSQFNG